MKAQTKDSKHENPVSEATGNAMKNYEQAVRTSLKLQEEASKWWTSMFNQASVSQEWQKRMGEITGMANQFMPIAQRRMEDMMGLIEKSNRTSAEVFKKAIDAAQSPAAPDSQAKWMDVWASSMGAVRTNTEALSEMSSKTIDSWIGFIRKNSEMAETRAAKAI